ncbi:MAG: hypothetical protein SGARI_002395, partial [Bacillariaceae sp.]
VIDYDGDYGYPQGPEYFKTQVTKSEVDTVANAEQELIEAAREKKEAEREEALQRHYKGKLLKKSAARTNCEAMDTVLDNLEVLQKKQIRNEFANSPLDVSGFSDAAKKEFVLFQSAVKDLKLALEPIAESSGMQLKGKRDESLNRRDDRSMLELALCEEVVEAVLYFFAGIEDRMAKLRIKDQVFKSSMDQLRKVLDELHARNLQSIEQLQKIETRPPPSRKLKTREAIRAQVQEEMNESSQDESNPTQATSSSHPPRDAAHGGLMAALKAKGPLPAIDEGRGGLMAAIKAKKGGNGNDGGRGDMLAAIKAKKGGPGGAMPGGLLAAIKKRAVVE